VRIEVEHGAIITDEEGGLWRVLKVTDDGLFLFMLPERRSVVHTRSVSWRDFVECGYEMKFP